MKRILFLTLAFLALFVCPILAQVVDTTGLADNPVYTTPDVGTLVDAYNILYGALVIAWGYVAKSFGLKTKAGNNFVFVVAAGAVVLAGGFIAFGVGKALPLLFGFLSSIGVYDVIFKPLFGARKKPATA